MPGEDVRRIFKKVMEVIDSGCRTNRGVNGQRQDRSRTPGEAILDERSVQHPWDKAGRHFCDGPEKWKINNLSFKTLTDYLCGVRGEQHPKRGIRESVAAQEAEVTMRPLCTVHPETLAGRDREPRNDSAVSRDPRRQDPGSRDFPYSGLKDAGGDRDVADRCGESHGRSRNGGVGEVVHGVAVNRRKDLEGCHVDRSTADAAVELRKPLEDARTTGIVICILGMQDTSINRRTARRVGKKRLPALIECRHGHLYEKNSRGSWINNYLHRMDTGVEGREE
ncbi:hypothetical protein DFH09DRAFT_1104465 [Mycena vulgaris]|nr:hypothetical protein DFH09DRAFT_1104465 [Mycena vulgaris]